MLDFKELFKLSSDKGLDDIQVTVENKNSMKLNYANGALERNETTNITSLTFTASLNGKLATYYVENLNVEPIDVVNALYEASSKLTSNEVSEIFAGSKEYPKFEVKASDFHNVPLQDKINFLGQVETKIKEKDKRVVQIPMLQYLEEVQKTRIINSKGLDIAKENEYCVVIGEVVVVDGGNPQVGFDVEVNANFKDINLDDVVNKTVDKAVKMLNAKSMESGDYPIIIENEALRDMFAAFGGLFSGEAHLKKVSPLNGKLGEKVFSDKITIVDEPLKADAIVREPFDDEGVACYNKTIVENGVFKCMLHNLKTAKAFNTESTGNAFNGSAFGCNLYIKPGKKTKDELIASIEKGLLLTGFDGLHAGLNPISGDFSLKTEGFLIENGKISRPVTLIVATGNFIKMLNDIEEVGSDLLLDYQGIGAPSIKFNKLSISGQ